MALACCACCSLVALFSWCHSELRRLHCLPVDCYSWSKLLPSIAHDLELSCDGQQLGRWSVAHFYCEFFHWMVGLFSGRAASFIVRISFFTSRKISSRASAILFNCLSFMLPVYPRACRLSTCNFFSCTLMGGPTRLRAWRLEALLIFFIFFRWRAKLIVCE